MPSKQLCCVCVRGGGGLKPSPSFSFFDSCIWDSSFVSSHAGFDERRRTEDLIPSMWTWGISSNGRALALHARGRGIDAPILQMLHIAATIILMKRCVFHSFIRLGVGKPGGSMPPTSKWFILRRRMPWRKDVFSTVSCDWAREAEKYFCFFHCVIFCALVSKVTGR